MCVTLLYSAPALGLAGKYAAGDYLHKCHDCGFEWGSVSTLIPNPANTNQTKSQYLLRRSSKSLMHATASILLLFVRISCPKNALQSLLPQSAAASAPTTRSLPHLCPERLPPVRLPLLCCPSRPSCFLSAVSRAAATRASSAPPLSLTLCFLSSWYL